MRFTPSGIATRSMWSSPSYLGPNLYQPWQVAQVQISLQYADLHSYLLVNRICFRTLQGMSSNHFPVTLLLHKWATFHSFTCSQMKHYRSRFPKQTRQLHDASCHTG